MFDIGWTELLLIAVIAIVVVGPKELPAMMRTVGRYATRMRRMAREVQGQFEEALREAELDEVRKDIRDIGRLDPVREVREGLARPIKSVRKDIEKAGQDIAATGASEAAAPALSAPPVKEPAAPPAAPPARELAAPLAEPESGEGAGEGGSPAPAEGAKPKRVAGAS